MQVVGGCRRSLRCRPSERRIGGLAQANEVLGELRGGEQPEGPEHGPHTAQARLRRPAARPKTPHVEQPIPAGGPERAVVERVRQGLGLFVGDAPAGPDPAVGQPPAREVAGRRRRGHRPARAATADSPLPPRAAGGRAIARAPGAGRGGQRVAERLLQALEPAGRAVQDRQPGGEVVEPQGLGVHAASRCQSSRRPTTSPSIRPRISVRSQFICPMPSMKLRGGASRPAS